MTTPAEQFDPNDVLREGDFDAAALLLLWLGRKLFLPTLLLGIIVAVLVTQDVASVGDEVARRIENLDTLAELIAVLASPFSLIIVALVLRVVMEFLALALAYPLTRWNRAEDYARRGKSGSYARMWLDRVHMAGSFRSLRWSWVVRQAAADRLGRPGQVLEVLSPVLTWIGVALFAALVGVLAITN